MLALGRTDATLDGITDDDTPGAGRPGAVTPLGIVVLAERLRPQTRETVAFLCAEGVELKVISGDAPETVAAIAADAGVPMGGPPLDGDALPADPAEARRVALEATVVGHISPEGKRRFVEALRDAGRCVAMVGDGVNDVPALKAARLAIAQGGGTQMAKSIADIVLVNGDFGAVPPMVAEGRQLLRNLQRVTKLFVTKSAFAAVLILTIGIAPTTYPLLPRHLTLAASLTVGIPAFFLALAPSDGTWRSAGFLRDVTRFALPAGTAAALGLVSSYLFAFEVLNLPRVEARTVAVTVMVIVGLYFILVLEASGRARAAAVGGLCALLFALHWLVLAFAGTRDFFELASPSAAIRALLHRRRGPRDLRAVADRRPLHAPPAALAAPARRAGTIENDLSEIVVTPALDARRLREDFPVFNRTFCGKSLAYLDSANSSQKPRQVLDAMRRFYEKLVCERPPGVRDRRALDGRLRGREKFYQLVNAASTREVIFTRNGTEALNLVAYAWGLDNLGPGDVAISTALEHHSNFVPWQYIAKRCGAEFAVIPIDGQGERALESLAEIEKRGRVKLLACAVISNTLGTISPVAELAAWAHERDAILVADACQAVPNRPVNVQEAAATSSPSPATRCSLRAGSACSGDGKSCSAGWLRRTGRRLDDPQGDREDDDLGRPPVQVRGGNATDRGGVRARPCGGLPAGGGARRDRTLRARSSPATRSSASPSSRT